MTFAASRPDMPAKVKTALRTLLLSTSDVPGTEGRRTNLRYNGHGNNLPFGAPTFFITPNFAVTYNPLVLQIHAGPSKHAHLDIFRSSTSAEIAKAEPTMPSLERMHQIGAEDPRAQAKFFMLMTELHYRFVIGVDRLLIRRVTLARPRRPIHDQVAASLHPCITPGIQDVQAPFESQGRGFEHGHGKGHGVIGTTMRWLRAAVDTGLAAAARLMNKATIARAKTVQYESARESARQMDVHDCSQSHSP